MTQEPIQNIINNQIELTPYGATKTAELDLQFSIDASYGLTRRRYGWFSDETQFDSSYFDDSGGSITMTTSATADADARLRSAYPGKYIAHTVAEPGVGVHIPTEHLEYDSDDRVSLTHGEISIALTEWDSNNDTGVVSYGFSYEADATYIQIRSNNADIAFVPQEDWNIDTMDGTGPSGKILRPDEGYVYNFPYTWYGFGGMMLGIQDKETGRFLPVHKETFDGNVPIETPNMPVQVTVENKNTAQSLTANVGGMQFATHGAANRETDEGGRLTEVSRRTASNYINRNVTVTNNEIRPFAQPGRPLIAVRRDIDELVSRTALGVEVQDFFINSGGNVYIFIFDEWNEDTALTNENFREPGSQQLAEESRVEVDTEATDYTPSSDAVLRGMLFVAGDKNTAEVISGDATARMPIDSATVVTAALPVGANSTYAQPALLQVKESY